MSALVALAVVRPELRDAYGRRIDYLRISVTDRCNLRCVYCLPKAGTHWQPLPDMLTVPELLRVIDGSGADDVEALVRLLDRRVQRMHLLLAPPGSLLLRHPLLRSLRHDVEDRVDDSQRWPAGAIPGTGR